MHMGQLPSFITFRPAKLQLLLAATRMIHTMDPSVCSRNLNKIIHRSITALNHFLCKSTLHLRNDLTVMARYRFDPPTHTLLSHIHAFILTIGPHSCEPLRFWSHKSTILKRWISAEAVYGRIQSWNNGTTEYYNHKKHQKKRVFVCEKSMPPGRWNTVNH